MQAGSPYWLRYTARSDSAFGSSWASTMATVWPLPAVAESLYALSRLEGPYPDGVAFGTTAWSLNTAGCLVSVCRMAKHVM